METKTCTGGYKELPQRVFITCGHLGESAKLHRSSFWIFCQMTVERISWLDNLKLPFRTKHFTETKPNGYIHYVFWCDEDNCCAFTTCINIIRARIPIYASRQMKQGFIELFSKTVSCKPAVPRAIYKHLTGDSSAPESTHQGVVDDQLMEFLLTSDEDQMAYDLRKNNEKVKDEKFDPFWNALATAVEKDVVVNERRHNDVLFTPKAISVSSLITEVESSLPTGTPIPSLSAVKLANKSLQP